METLKLNLSGVTYVLVLFKNSYSVNNSLYLGLLDANTYEPFADITVNLRDGMSSMNMQYLDTNGLSDVVKLVEDYNLGSNTGLIGKSGFCTYPLYCFDEEEYSKYLVDEETLRKAGII